MKLTLKENIYSILLWLGILVLLPVVLYLLIENYTLATVCTITGMGIIVISFSVRYLLKNKYKRT